MLGSKSPFTSLDPEIADAAWDTIEVSGTLGWLKMPNEDMDAMGAKSVEFKDGSGQLVALDVFHQLHCLNYLRKKTSLYSPLYHDMAHEEEIPAQYHIPHCIDSIRMPLQCHADLSVISQRWADGWMEPWATWENNHRCRNFDKIKEWAIEKYPVLAWQMVHPQLGYVMSGQNNISALPLLDELKDEE
ncbi:uncharacterized protein BCR38DRAFT_424932 [Pseudomassariella vexata]|uniref:Tat pathway signal sequence n=1 Tax=Pseudomassariella vexata TaxID=1141098 RepID=A0A1Y2EBP4_9PEZI|nr:uncharacterized protein BCR38DRAFT_424932 [Pseudomassariella vexata]ORY68978.1 hypothetical protein BCR38DRAFT_424932 [Pseudomassariella vexata]